MRENTFDLVISRSNTSSVKWDFMGQYLHLSEPGMLPMWVSDFDFQCPSEVQQALHERVDHGIFGYSERDAHYFQAVIAWFERRHNLHLKREWFTSVEGVVPGIALLIQLLSKVGDRIVVQGPYYGSFARIIRMNGRELLDNPLTEGPAGYLFDFDHLESCFIQHRPPVLVLCNPHNPSGRCWREEELLQLLELCNQYNVTVISDEIWADLTLPGQKFTSVLHLGVQFHDRVISATSASKSFGLSSLRISNFLIPCSTLRQAFVERLHAHGLDVFNALSMTAATAAYQYGDSWLNDLQTYLARNRIWFEKELAIHAPWCRLTPAEGTYLAWLDCRRLNMSDEELQKTLIHKSGLVASMGSSFGNEGNGYIRINLGCPRLYLEKAIEGLSRLTH